MRTLLMVLMIAGMMSTAGVYAEGFGSTLTTKTLAGSVDEPVCAPNIRSIALGYVTTGTLNIHSSGTVARTDTVTISSREVGAISTLAVEIAQN